MQADGEPFLYPNEEIYNRTPDITFIDENAKIKIYQGIAIVTTHRVLFVKGQNGLQIPIHYIKKFSQEGGIISDLRIEIFLDKNKMQGSL